MFCRNCGKPVDEKTGKFCGSCGAMITPVTSPQPPVQPNYASRPGVPPVQPQYVQGQGTVPQPYAYNKPSLEEVNKVVQIILSIGLAIFALLNAIAIFFPLMIDEESVVEILKEGGEWGSPWIGLIASILAIIMILSCWKSETTGYPWVVILAIVIMILDIVFIGKWKVIIMDDEWGNWKNYRSTGLTFYTLGSVWIPIFAIFKCVMDVVADKFVRPSYATRQFPNLGPASGQTHLSHFVNNNEPTPQHYSNNSAHVLSSKTSATSSATHSPQNGWVCKDCGRINYPYVGTCACGTDKDA